jgi:hypothetical protein
LRKDKRKDKLYRTHHVTWKGKKILAETHPRKRKLGDQVIGGSRVLK